MAYRIVCSLFIFALVGGHTVFASPSLYREDIRRAASRYSLDPALVEAIVTEESGGDAKAISKKGAMGLMQVMPKTANQLRIDDPFHPLNHLMGTCQYLRDLINSFSGNLELALAAYNAGPTRVAKLGRVPSIKETQNYVRRVLARYSRLRG